MDSEKLNNLRHSCSHLMAAAILELYPEAQPTIGPATADGFYYDFDNLQVSEEDLGKIEEKMKQLLPAWVDFTHREVSADEAKEVFKNNPYKLEIINEIVEKGEKITLYKSGDFEDLCRGGHSEKPSEDIGALKLLSVAGAYWRGSEKNKMLTRVYGTAFSTQQELDDYLNMLEEAKKRDHKKLGLQLDLFFFNETSPGMAYWLPKGLTLYNTMYGFAREMYKKYGYQEVATPILNKQGLYETSGHWSHYKDDMFLSDMGENEMFGIKPMNCPNAMVIFGHKTRSYNDLPLRLAETTLLHRFELSGTLNGLFRIREFRQDDAHIFISQSQIKEEFEKLIKMIEEVYTAFGLQYRLRYGTRPEGFLGEPKDWDLAETSLKEVLDESGKEYFEMAGEGAFYGPKIDILMKDTLGREWQTGTIQLDFQHPQRFNLKYTDSEGKEQTPVVIHRAIFGSIERFLGVITEHYAGAFPTWLAPVQAVVVPISDKNLEYGNKVLEQLKQAGIRVEIDARSEKMQAKIRDAQLQKVPYMLVLGGREEEAGQVAVRKRNGEDLGAIEVGVFLEQIKAEIESKA